MFFLDEKVQALFYIMDDKLIFVFGKSIELKYIKAVN